MTTWLIILSVITIMNLLLVAYLLDWKIDDKHKTEGYNEALASRTPLHRTEELEEFVLDVNKDAGYLRKKLYELYDYLEVEHYKPDCTPYLRKKEDKE